VLGKLQEKYKFFKKGGINMGRTLEELERRIVELEEKIKKLEQRLQVLEDKDEIRELQHKYVDALICTEWDECAECFAEDATVNVYLHEPVHGKEAIRRWFKEELSKTHAGKEGDFVVHPIIEVSGDKAKGRWLLYLMYMYPRTGQSLFWVQGYYRNEYVREKGRWKISLMTWTERLGLPGGGPPTGLW